MNKYTVLDMAKWPRRRIFEFYRNFDAPCFNISVKLRADAIYQLAKERGDSFFLLSLYAILRAANRIPQIRQRVIDGRAVEFERIAVMTPIMTKEEMFQQIWCEYHDNFADFKADAAAKVAKAAAGTPAPLEQHGEDFLCASCLPWLHFESITQADAAFDQTIPILAWGKMEDGKIPVSVKFNHCFLDGLHVSRFFTEIQAGFATPKTLYSDVKIGI